MRGRATEDPLVSTPGDNEWTDCHRTNNGGYDPLERHATRRHAAAVVIGIQADMWDGAFSGPDDAPSQYDRFTPIVRELAADARAFGRPVLLLNGDSHAFTDDRPLADAATPCQRTMYGVTQTVPNLRRITVNGSTTPCHEWPRLGIDPTADGVFSVARIRFAHQPGFDPAVCPAAP